MRFRHASQRVYGYEQGDQRLRHGLIGHWPGNGSGRTLVDSSGYGLHGAFVGNPGWSAKPNGIPAFSLDGTSDYITCPNVPALTQFGDKTISLWVNTLNARAGATHAAFCASWDGNTGFILWIGVGDGNVYLGTASESTKVNWSGGEAILSDGAWHHLLAKVYDFNGSSSTAAIWADGVERATNTGIVNTQSTGDLYFGTYLGGSGKYSGLLAEPRVYDRALSDAEIKLLADPSFLPFAQTGRRRINAVAAAAGSILLFVADDMAGMSGGMRGMRG